VSVIAIHCVARRVKSFRLLAVLILGSLSPWVFSDWPATQFQVQTREPVTLEKADIRQETDTGPGLLESMRESVAGPKASTGTAESWMNAIAGVYRNGGHEAPYIQPIVQVDGIPKYRVYIFPYTDSRFRSNSAHARGGYQLSDCVGSSQINWVSYNSDKLSPGASLPKSYYWTFAHETFHALQYGDQLMANCFDGPKWITEGLADGAGSYLTNKKWRNYSGRISSSATAVGLRHYDWPLDFSTGRKNVGPKSLEMKTYYLTGSFWQFFAENFGGVKVFSHFLDVPLAKKARGSELLEWLDDRLRTEPNIQSGLYLAYPHFVTEFASYGGQRYTSFNSRRYGTGEAARRAWLKSAFTKCHDITLTPEQSVQEIPISIMKVAAICIRVRMEGFAGNTTEQIEVISDRLDILDQLHLGWAWIDGPDGLRNCFKEHKLRKTLWPPCILKPFSQTGPSLGTYARTWATDMLDFKSSGAVAEKIYILSNVAELPWKTKAVTGYTLKIGLANSTLNGEPAEPMHHRPIQRKTALKNPMGKVGKEELYGLQTDPPLPSDTLAGIALNRYVSDRNKGAKASTVGGYEIAITGLQYGQTGPIRGIVALQASDPRNRTGPVSSVFCKGASTTPIGEATRSDEKALRISIDADVCQAGPTTMKQCERNGCPVVDHVVGEVNVSFGWRQFSSTAPTDIRTPGIERYIETMPDSIEEAMRFGANTAIPDTTASPGDSGDSNGASNSASGALEPCACTCEELAANDAAAADFKARIAAGAEPSMDDISGFSRCATSCQRQYMICRMDQAEAEKRAEKEKREQESGSEQDCDCSCAQMTANNERASELEKQFVSGADISMEDIEGLTRCAQVCRQQHLACIMEQR
jgi:hypothetical protein